MNRHILITNPYIATNPEEIVRNGVAEQTWHNLCKLNPIGFSLSPIPTEDLSRNSKSELGDTRQLPFVKDLVNEGIRRARKKFKQLKKGTRISIANADSCIHPDFELTVEEHFQTGREAVRFVRRNVNFEYTHPLPYYSILSELNDDQHIASGDVFTFTLEWWNRHAKEYPDMLMGCQWWDTILCDLMLKNGEDELYDYESTCIRSIVYHRTHDPYWYRNGSHMFDNPGQAYNRKLAYNWKSPAGSSSWIPQIREWEEGLQERHVHNIGNKVIKTGKRTIVM